MITRLQVCVYSIRLCVCSSRIARLSVREFRVCKTATVGGLKDCHNDRSDFDVCTRCRSALQQLVAFVEDGQTWSSLYLRRAACRGSHALKFKHDLTPSDSPFIQGAGWGWPILVCGLGNHQVFLIKRGGERSGCGRRAVRSRSRRTGT